MNHAKPPEARSPPRGVVALAPNLRLMRGGSRTGLILTGLAVAGLLTPPPALAKGRRAAGPQRGWVVDRVRLENVEAGGFLSVGGAGDFRGVVDLVPAAGGVAVVNEVALDDYIQGVAEVPSSWPVEALRAQAIAARTFALHEMARKAPTTASAVGAHICAVEACQRYVGMAKERQDHGSSWVAAVRSTAGQVVLYRGAPILAQYSSSNGGRSVAGGRPYLRAADDPDSARGPYNRWRVGVGYDQLTSAFHLPGPLTTLRRAGEAVALDWAVPDGPSGQAVVPVADFRARLNEAVPPPDGLPRTVPSPQFAVVADDGAGTAFLEGRGHGHGIGMSQFGALGKASRGMRAGDILASYYGGLRPATVPPEQLPATIRVVLDTGRGAVTAGGSGRFRVLDGSGAPVAVAATGDWRILPAGRGKVRVVPPADQEGAPALEPLTADPPGTTGAPTGQARFRLSAPALVRLRVEGVRLPTPVETAPAMLEPGDAAVPLPALPGPGRYLVSVLADAGAGRVAAAQLPVRVAASGKDLRPGARTAGIGPAPGLPRPGAVAWALLVIVVSCLGRLAVRHRTRPGRPG